MTKPQRPLSVTIPAVIVLCISAWNAIRAGTTLLHWNTLTRFGAPSIYLLSTGIFWAIIGLFLFKALWEGTNYGFRAGLLISVLYFAWYWFDRLVVQVSPAPNFIFSLIVSVALTAYFIFSLAIPDSRDYFTKERG